MTPDSERQPRHPIAMALAVAMWWGGIVAFTTMVVSAVWRFMN